MISIISKSMQDRRNFPIARIITPPQQVHHSRLAINNESGLRAFVNATLILDRSEHTPRAEQHTRLWDQEKMDEQTRQARQK